MDTFDLKKYLAEGKLYEAAMACPLPTQDLELNTKNRDSAIKADYIKYGPLNVDEPGDYWEELAEHWDTTVEAAKQSLCTNCAAFDISPRMEDCMPGPLSDNDGRLGYCWMHSFKCHSARTCRTWVKGGPIEKDSISYEWQERKVLNEKYYEYLVGDEYSEGGQHQVYDYGEEGDKVIKFPHGRGKIGYNVKILAKYPEIFPKVFDIGEDHIVLEKLNDKKAYNEVWKIKPYLFSNSSEIPPKNPYIAKLAQRSRIKGSNWYNSTLSELIYNNLDDEELKLQLHKELPSDLYNSLIKNWYPLLQKVKNLPWKNQIEKDINDENFGYNSKGELKMLDI